MILAKDERYISTSYTRSYPLVIDRGEGAYVEDPDGNRFLDFTCGIAVNALGHCPPEVVRVIQEQAGRFLHMAGTDFYYRLQSDLAEKLCQITPGSFPKRVFFANSGTETIEAALKLARYATRRPKFIAFHGAFHGRTMGSLALNASKPLHRKNFGSTMPEVVHVPYGYCYRCASREDAPVGGCDPHSVAYIEEEIFHRLVPPDEVAAVFVEPIQGEGGYLVPPSSWLQDLRKLCDRHGILLIADEIQTGLGRTGRMFAIEHSGVVPDMICTAKALAGGLPLGALVARADLMAWESGAHANTFGGNPVACAAALKTIELIQSQNLPSNAAKTGTHFLGGLRRLQKKYDAIGDVRGLGLMIGIEIVTDKKSRQRNPDLRNRIVAEAFRRGLLLLGCGENSIRFLPPLNITNAHIDVALDILDASLESAITQGAAPAGKPAASAVNREAKAPAAKSAPKKKAASRPRPRKAAAKKTRRSARR